nr:hypothetical protein CFP56_31035 [Quercus suber]
MATAMLSGLKSDHDEMATAREPRQTADREATNGNEQVVPGSDTVIQIAQDGDLIIGVQHDESPVHLFRVSTAVLRKSSRYCERLLQRDRFGEGAQIEVAHQDLQKRYTSMKDVPIHELPRVVVQDLGRISAVKALDALCADLFHILHADGRELPVPPPIANLANLAIVADRFDALEAVKSYARRKKVFRAIDGKTTAKVDAVLNEERSRQRLLAATMLEHAPWVEKYSTRLILKGWVGSEVDISAPLWCDIPATIEEELTYRRESILETIQSLQSYFLALYTSRDRQCKLGYDSSAQCDSFQLGEMIRFFKRSGTLQLQSSIFDTTEQPLPYPGDVSVLLDALRQAPEYQIDRNHNHCGIRTRLMPLLDLIQECLQHVGICLECWSINRESYAWLDLKPPLLWKRQKLCLRGQSHANLHAEIRAMFTASDRDWEA